MELIINLSEQWLELRGERTERFPVSTARNGAGQAMGSEGHAPGPASGAGPLR
ncbi:L,D-transpeptidase [Alcanivorax sp.]|uniref:L,D-transpeptidase n=1 Tax=Alcanivorax sp. TaxID=1872427 RepID=UPI003BA96BB7